MRFLHMPRLEEIFELPDPRYGPGYDTKATSKCLSCGDEDMVDEVEELTDEQLNSHTFHDEDDETTRTFEAQLLKRIKEGATTPEMFASTEY